MKYDEIKTKFQVFIDLDLFLFFIQRQLNYNLSSFVILHMWLHVIMKYLTMDVVIL